jgi:chromosome segregation ATPase
MKPFKLYEQYVKQDQGIAEARLRYDEKVAEAKRKVEELKVKLDEVVTLEITTGVDKTRDKAQIRKEIEQAEKDVTHAEEERKAAYTYFSGPGGSIRKSDVVQAWLKDYLPTVRDEELTPIKERIEQGQNIILSALYDFFQLEKEYNDITREVHALDEAAHNSGEQPTRFAIENPFQLRLVWDGKKFDQDLGFVGDYKELPKHVTYYDKSFVVKKGAK